jgi:hypothetical protein
MFGHEERDWLAPYESVYDQAAHEDVASARPSATKGASVYRSAKGPYGVKGAKGVRTAPALVNKGLLRLQQAAEMYGHTPQYQYAAGYAPHPKGLREKRRHGLRGFGDIDVPYTTSSGASGSAHLTTASRCGSVFGVQQMLTDLGYPVAIDGTLGPETLAAVKAYASASGVAYRQGSYPSGALCQSMEDAWTAAHGAPAAPAAPTVPAVPAPAPAPTAAPTSWWGGLPTTTQYLIAGTGAVAAAVVIASLVKGRA